MFVCIPYKRRQLTLHPGLWCSKHQGTLWRHLKIMCILGNTTADGTVLLEALIMRHEVTSAVNCLTPHAVITFFVLDLLRHLLILCSNFYSVIRNCVWPPQPVTTFRNIVHVKFLFPRSTTSLKLKGA
jgi:hypothetical protein